MDSDTKKSSEIEKSKDEKSVEETKRESSIETVLDLLIDGYKRDPIEVAKKKFSAALTDLLKQDAKKYKLLEKYNILLLFDNTTIVKGDSDRIYQAISELGKDKKPLLLILLSRGGEPGSAYLIGKLCRESCHGKFVIAIPRYAKSAATLLATAADEIHMGSLSELGPIDPQIDGMPALGLKNSIEHIAELVSRIPQSAEMFAEYLKNSVKPITIGYYERAAQSAEQYAERLLESHQSTLPKKPAEIAHKLVHEYKDHGFVIDKSEAEMIFGAETIKSNTAEYQLSNLIYKELSRVEEISRILGYNFYFIGSLNSDPQMVKRGEV